MNPEQWLSLKWNGGSTMSDRWLNQSKIIHPVITTILLLLFSLNRLIFAFIQKLPITNSLKS